MSQQHICSIGELANEFDITTRSVRFYEDQGLLIPYRRGNTRIFDDKCRTRLKLILRNKRMGFSLSEIKDLFRPVGRSNTQRQRETTPADAGHFGPQTVAA